MLLCYQRVQNNAASEEVRAASSWACFNRVFEAALKFQNLGLRTELHDESLHTNSSLTLF